MLHITVMYPKMVLNSNIKFENYALFNFLVIEFIVENHRKLFQSHAANQL